MNCLICKRNTSLIFKTKVLNKYDVNYFQCDSCGFIQTEEPYWLKEAYTEAIAATDVGLVSRNLLFRDITEQVLTTLFPEYKRMLDYGGGYGLFVRMMRDRGFDFYRQDQFCKNIFSQYFDVTDTIDKKFDIVTAFELFEHMADPLNEIENMFKYAPTILFSTQLAPDTVDKFKRWWYVSPLSGQHISFYKLESLQFIAKHFKKKLYSNGVNLHILTDKEIDSSKVIKILNYNSDNFLNRLRDLFMKSKRISLTEKDHEYVTMKVKDDRGAAK